MTRQPKPPIRPTRATRRVLLALLSGAGNLHARRLGEAAGVRSWTLYPFLEHLEAAGWTDKHRRHVGLERKYCYDLTDIGRLHAAAELGLILPVLLCSCRRCRPECFQFNALRFGLLATLQFRLEYPQCCGDGALCTHLVLLHGGEIKVF